MPRTSVSATMDFACSPTAVWDVLSSVDSFALWYTPADGFAGGEIALGSKLYFPEWKITSVVTVYEPAFRLVLSSSRITDELLIREEPTGCRVTLRTAGNLPGENGGLQQRNEEMLDKLREASYGSAARSAVAKRPAPRRRLGAILSGVLQGYRSPIERRSSALQESEELSSLIDNSEADVRIHLRSGIAAAICLVLLVSILSFVSRFEQSDIVPSSGLSVMESDDVNKQTVSLIQMGQTKASLELMLNCQGERLSPTEFYYCSVQRLYSGQPRYELYVTYDAYSRVRRAVFIDKDQSRQLLEMPPKSAKEYASFSMNPCETEQALDYPLSAFWLDKNGTTVVYFGVFTGDGRDFDTGVTAELVVTLNTATREVKGTYYLPKDTNNALDAAALTRELRRQYGHIDQYLEDFWAYERTFLLLGKQMGEPEILLDAEVSEFEEGSDGDVTQILRISSSYAEGDDDERFAYTLVYNVDGYVCAASLLNNYLETRFDTMQDISAYNIEEGMSLKEVYAEMGILPTYIEYGFEETVLFFGPRTGNRRDNTRNYPVVVVFSTSGHAVQNSYFNA